MLIVLACTAAPVDSAAPAADPTTAGAWSVGRRTVVLDDAERPLTVEVWYPTHQEATPTAVPQAYLSGQQQADYAALLAAAPPDCPTLTTQAIADAEPADGGPWPAVLFSHCHTCTRFSSFTQAQRLASHGVVVVAPDHAGNTLLDEVSLGLNTDTLELRRSDGVRTLDALLAGELGVADLDADAIGVVGHSFGSVTAGLIAQSDPRISAAMGIAAPMATPTLPGVELSSIEMPLMLVVAEEDNSISEAGNFLIRSNYEDAIGPAWKAEVADAGHWSFSDLCGVVEDFEPGCGEGERQTEPGEPFTYLDPAQGREVISALAAAFFLQTLSGQSEQLDELSLSGVSLDARSSSP